MNDPVTFDLTRLDFSAGDGYVTVITQDASSGCVLMTARADREAVLQTVATGEMHYHSRTRGLWHKGATSGHRQRVVSLAADCDGDAVLARVVPLGPACHAGTPSCFDGMTASPRDPSALAALDALIAEHAASSNPDQHSTGYTRRLLADRNLRLKKLGEEAAELAVACADDDAARARAEGADLLYHMLVALRAVGVGLADVVGVLEERRLARSVP